MGGGSSVQMNSEHEAHHANAVAAVEAVIADKGDDDMIPKADLVNAIKDNENNPLDEDGAKAWVDGIKDVGDDGAEIETAIPDEVKVAQVKEYVVKINTKLKPAEEPKAEGEAQPAEGEAVAAA